MSLVLSDRTSYGVNSASWYWFLLFILSRQPTRCRAIHRLAAKWNCDRSTMRQDAVGHVTAFVFNLAWEYFLSFLVVRGFHKNVSVGVIRTFYYTFVSC
jgi:hypothetical protein